MSVAHRLEVISKLAVPLRRQRKKSSKGALTLEVPKVEEFYHLIEDNEEAAQFCVENEYEDDDENDAYEIVNLTRPRSRPR